MTARVSSKNFDSHKQRSKIEQWSVEHIGTMLPITSEKDPDMIELWDDRVVCVEEYTGRYVRFKENGEIKHR